MENNTTNYVDQYLEKQRQERRRKKVITIISICVILLLIMTRIVYKKYTKYMDEKRYYTNQVISLNQTILRDYKQYLSSTQRICVALLLHEENHYAQRSYDLTYPTNIHVTGLLRMLSNGNEYHIDMMDISEFQDFLRTSNSCLRELIKQDQITKEQKEYISVIYNTYGELYELYNDLIREKLYTLRDSERQDAEFQLFYEGAFLYNYVNHAYPIIDNIPSYVATEKSIQSDKNSEKHSDEQIELFKKAMSRKDAKAYAIALTKVIFDDPKDLIEIKNSTETYDPLTRSGSIYEDGSGEYLISLTYSCDDFNENESIDIDLVHKGAYYNNRRTPSETELSHEALDSIAESVINRLGYQSLRLKHRYEPNYHTDVFSYYYVIAEEDYEDETNTIHLTLYSDGRVESFSVSNDQILYGTYEKEKAAISLDDAKKALTEESRKAITDWTLAVGYNDKLYYKFTITIYDQELFVFVDADTGQLFQVTDE